MDDIFANMPLIEEQPVVVDQKTFVPTGTKQKQRNQQKKKIPADVKQPDLPSTATPDAETTIDSTPAKQEPRSAPVSSLTPVEALDLLIDQIPDLFESSAKVSEGIDALLPMKPMVRAVAVAAMAGFAVYLATRRDQ